MSRQADRGELSKAWRRPAGASPARPDALGLPTRSRTGSARQEDDACAPRISAPTQPACGDESSTTSASRIPASPRLWLLGAVSVARSVPASLRRSAEALAVAAAIAAGRDGGGLDAGAPAGRGKGGRGAEDLAAFGCAGDSPSGEDALPTSRRQGAPLAARGRRGRCDRRSKEAFEISIAPRPRVAPSSSASASAGKPRRPCFPVARSDRASTTGAAWA